MTSDSRSSSRRVARQPGDQLVADGVAERVVDVLEAVEVEHQDRAAMAVALGRSQRAVELLLEAAAVEQPGQRVVVGEVLQLALEALALGDVDDLADAVGGPAGLVGDGGDGHQHPDEMAVGVHHPALGRDPLLLAGDQRGEALCG